jgi:hypothetical protein
MDVDRIAEQLETEFGTQLPPSVVGEVVAQCLRDPTDKATGGTPDGIEEAARERLMFLDSPPAWTA